MNESDCVAAAAGVEAAAASPAPGPEPSCGDPSESAGQPQPRAIIPGQVSSGTTPCSGGPLGPHPHPKLSPAWGGAEGEGRGGVSRLRCRSADYHPSFPPQPACPDPQPREKPQVGGSLRGGRSGDTVGCTHTLWCLPCGLSVETFRKLFEILKAGVGSGERPLSHGGSLESERCPPWLRFPLCLEVKHVCLGGGG